MGNTCGCASEVKDGSQTDRHSNIQKLPEFSTKFRLEKLKRDEQLKIKPQQPMISEKKDKKEEEKEKVEPADMNKQIDNCKSIVGQGSVLGQNPQRSNYENKGIIFDLIGGQKGLKLYVEKLLENLLSHPQLKDYFKNLDQVIFKEKLIQYFEYLTGGRQLYIGKPLQQVHQKMKISDETFDCFTQVASDSLKQFFRENQVSDKLYILKKMVDALSSLREQIVCQRHAAGHQQTDYDLIGGVEVIKKITELTYEKINSDPQLSILFARSDQDKMKKKFVQYICHITGGPYEWFGKTITEGHQHLKITEAQFLQFVIFFYESMEKCYVDRNVQKNISEMITAIMPQVVHQSLYDKIQHQFQQISHEFQKEMFDDPLLKKYFQNIKNFDKHVSMFTSILACEAGIKHVNIQYDLKGTHSKLGITEADFERSIELFRKVISKYVEESQIYEAIQLYSQLKEQIVSPKVPEEVKQEELPPLKVDQGVFVKQETKYYEDFAQQMSIKSEQSKKEEIKEPPKPIQIDQGIQPQISMHDEQDQVSESFNQVQVKNESIQNISLGQIYEPPQQEEREVQVSQKSQSVPEIIQRMDQNDQTETPKHFMTPPQQETPRMEDDSPDKLDQGSMRQEEREESDQEPPVSHKEDCSRSSSSHSEQVKLRKNVQILEETPREQLPPQPHMDTPQQLDSSDNEVQVSNKMNPGMFINTIPEAMEYQEDSNIYQLRESEPTNELVITPSIKLEAKNYIESLFAEHFAFTPPGDSINIVGRDNSIHINQNVQSPVQPKSPKQKKGVREFKYILTELLGELFPKNLKGNLKYKTIKEGELQRLQVKTKKLLPRLLILNQGALFIYKDQMSLVKHCLKPLYVIPMEEIEIVKESEMELFPNQSRSKKIQVLEINLKQKYGRIAESIAQLVSLYALNKNDSTLASPLKDKHNRHNQNIGGQQYKKRNLTME